ERARRLLAEPRLRQRDHPRVGRYVREVALVRGRLGDVVVALLQARDVAARGRSLPSKIVRVRLCERRAALLRGTGAGGREQPGCSPWWPVSSSGLFGGVRTGARRATPSPPERRSATFRPQPTGQPALREVRYGERHQQP